MFKITPVTPYRLIAMLRVKDQIDTIDECLGKLSELVDAIVILDNGSTDGTLDCYLKYIKVVHVLKSEGYHEGRDKIILLNCVHKYNPEWIMWIDADEVFENRMTREILNSYMDSSRSRIQFRMCHFWLDKIHCRYDHEYFLYTLHPQRSMWRNTESAYFKNIKMHNGDIKGVYGRFISPYRLKHYGYADAMKMRKKYERYKKEDQNERNYAGLNPDLPYKAFIFRELRSKYLNMLYIYLYKYLCNILWLFERFRRKITLL